MLHELKERTEDVCKLNDFDIIHELAALHHGHEKMDAVQLDELQRKCVVFRQQEEFANSTSSFVHVLRANRIVGHLCLSSWFESNAKDVAVLELVSVFFGDVANLPRRSDILRWVCILEGVLLDVRDSPLSTYVGNDVCKLL